jgi:lipopolysaccharide/colanic/teichoic acid biosynthesis glycosyltransferase
MNSDETLDKPAIMLSESFLHYRTVFIKRAFDILLSGLGLILLSPLFLIMAIAIKRDTPGPVFYRGKRMGFRGTEFDILKFRTMYETPESYLGPKITASDDTRITPLGHWLRNTKLNELPQLWNVLIGDMSLVGPRPEYPDIARGWPQELADVVLSVRPGITSPASVVYRNEETLLCAENLLKKYLQDITPDKLRLDQLYVQYRSFSLDMDVLFWTFLILMPKLSNFSPPEALLFVGPATRFIRRYLNWYVIDLFITLCSFVVAEIFWRFYKPLNLGWAQDVSLTLAYALLFCLTESVMGVDQITWTKATLGDIYSLIVSWLISSVLVGLFSLIMPGFPLVVVIAASILALAGFVVVRYRTRLVVELLNWGLRYQKYSREMGERVLIVGTNQAGQHAAWLLSHPDNARKFWLAGFVENGFLRQGMRLYGASILGTVKDIPALLAKHKVSLLLLADRREFESDFDFISESCQVNATRLVVMPDILSTLGNMAKPKPSAKPEPALSPGLMNAGAMPLIPVTGLQEDSPPECETNPCEYCLIHSNPFQLQQQIEKLSEKMETGDLEGMRLCIQTMKETIQS